MAPKPGPCLFKVSKAGGSAKQRDDPKIVDVEFTVASLASQTWDCSKEPFTISTTIQITKGGTILVAMVIWSFSERPCKKTSS